MQFKKKYDVGWLKHFPASAQLKFGSASAQTFFGWTFAASALAPRSIHLPQYCGFTYNRKSTYGLLCVAR